MAIVGKINKPDRFKSNQIELFVIPEGNFSTLVGGATAPTKAAFLSAIKTYASKLTPDMRIPLAQDSDVVIDGKMVEEITEKLSMDEFDTEVPVESARLENYTIKFKAKMNTDYLIELLFVGAKILSDSTGFITMDFDDKTTDTIAEKGSIVIIKSVKTGDIIAGYKFIPTAAYPLQYQNKKAPEAEVTLKHIIGTNSFKCIGKIAPYTASDYTAYPTYSAT